MRLSQRALGSRIKYANCTHKSTGGQNRAAQGKQAQGEQDLLAAEWKSQQGKGEGRPNPGPTPGSVEHGHLPSACHEFLKGARLPSQWGEKSARKEEVEQEDWQEAEVPKCSRHDPKLLGEEAKTLLSIYNRVKSNDGSVHRRLATQASSLHLAKHKEGYLGAAQLATQEKRGCSSSLISDPAGRVSSSETRRAQDKEISTPATEQDHSATDPEL
ncbi:hypothetical protein Efla_004636 [Eimeria flavescens]